MTDIYSILTIYLNVRVSYVPPFLFYSFRSTFFETKSCIFLHFRYISDQYRKIKDLGMDGKKNFDKNYKYSFLIYKI